MRTYIPVMPSLPRFLTLYGGKSIRLIFSVTDIQSQEEEPSEGEEGESEDVDPCDPLPYPIRVSLAITKVKAKPTYYDMLIMLSVFRYRPRALER